MIINNIIAGFLTTMNLWTISFKHVYFHLNDVFMVTLMTLYMSLFMHHSNKLLIIPIIIMIYAVRTQLLISDTQFLKGMIPHHSMAILMSKNILYKTKNSKIKQLAKNIIDSQNKEIILMEKLLKK